MSALSRVFSGATITISASQFSIACVSIEAGTASRSSGAARIHARGVKFDSSKRDAQERVRVALGDDAHDLLEQRSSRRRAHDEDLPAGLDADARVDEQLGELTISRVGHGE